MRNNIKRLFWAHGSKIAALALFLAVTTANSTCFFMSHQPDEPAALSRLKK